MFITISYVTSHSMRCDRVHDGELVVTVQDEYTVLIWLCCHSPGWVDCAHTVVLSQSRMSILCSYGCVVTVQDEFTVLIWLCCHSPGWVYCAHMAVLSQLKSLVPLVKRIEWFRWRTLDRGDGRSGSFPDSCCVKSVLFEQGYTNQWICRSRF